MYVFEDYYRVVTVWRVSILFEGMVILLEGMVILLGGMVMLLERLFGCRC